MLARVGIDEAGRGALAGPLVVAVVLGKSDKLAFCDDSKKLSPKLRQHFYQKITEEADSYAVGWASASYIDRYGLSRALNKATREAFSQISYKNQVIIIDGPVDLLNVEGIKPRCVIGADNKVKQVSAASIIAKVTRDRYMIKQAKLFPGWGFEKHVGYGTKRHLMKLAGGQRLNLHRKTFKPLYEHQNNRTTS